MVEDQRNRGSLGRFGPGAAEQQRIFRFWISEGANETPPFNNAAKPYASLFLGSSMFPAVVSQLMADHLAPRAPHFPGTAKSVIFMASAVARLTSTL